MLPFIFKLLKVTLSLTPVQYLTFLSAFLTQSKTLLVMSSKIIFQHPVKCIDVAGLLPQFVMQKFKYKKVFLSCYQEFIGLVH